MITYILKTKSNEYYCGKTNNLQRRLEEHIKEKYPHWFCNSFRKQFVLVYKCDFDCEKNIKKFGVEKFVKCLNYHAGS